MSDIRWEGLDAPALHQRLSLPRVLLLDEVESTMDIAHELAANGAPSGSLVLAEAQRGGRGRGGKRWTSMAGYGIWFTLIERPARVSGLPVLSVRTGLRAAQALDRFAAEPVRVKWPNDLHLGSGKLAGILVEIRWRQARAEWVAIGFGVNVRTPAVVGAAGLRAGVSRLDVLGALVPAVRSAAAADHALSEEELTLWQARDLCAGRLAIEPAAGVVRGLSADGALLLETANGTARCSSGSLILAEDA